MYDKTDTEINKSFRVLYINENLTRGETVSKKQLSDEFLVSEKTIQRDIEELKTYHFEKDRSVVKFDARRHGYILEKQPEHQLTNKEIVTLNKILLESRALNKDEFAQIFEKLVFQASPEDRKQIRSLMLNECYHYVPMKHGKPLFDLI
jgi:predicted DNA-binding transcriptional regulator YafY